MNGIKNSDYNKLADEVLINLIRQDDEKAFAVLYERYSGALYVHAYGLIQNREDTKDLLQRVFTKIWDIRDTLHSEINLSAYLYQMLKNMFINNLAHSKVVDRYLDNLSEYAKTYVADTDYSIREKQLQACIQSEIQQLPPKMREIFELSRTAYLTHREIAEKLGISEKTVKNQITNALKLLKSKLPHLIFLLVLFQVRP